MAILLSKNRLYKHEGLKFFNGLLGYKFKVMVYWLNRKVELL